MLLEHLISKIRRLRTAVGDARELNVSKFTPRTGSNTNQLAIYQDFKGGMSQEQMENAAWTTIHAISDLHDHFRKWARANGCSPDEADEVIRRSEDLQLMMDLANFDKHGAHDRSGGWSGKRPTLREVNRVLRLQGSGGSPFGLALTPQGPQVFGTTNAAVVITGDIVDDSGNRLRILPDAQAHAVEAWETLIVAWKISPSRVGRPMTGSPARLFRRSPLFAR